MSDDYKELPTTLLSRHTQRSKEIPHTHTHAHTHSQLGLHSVTFKPLADLDSPRVDQ